MDNPDPLAWGITPNGKPMRYLFVLLPLVISSLCFSQKKKTKKEGTEMNTVSKIIVPKNKTDSIAFESNLIEGARFFLIQNHEKALENFLKAFELNNQSGAVNFKLAQCYLALYDSEKSLYHASKATRLSPSNKYYWKLLANIQIQHLDFKGAINAYRKIVEMYPKEKSGYIEMALVYQKIGDIKNVLSVYDQLEKNIGIDKNIVRNRQNIYIITGNKKGVIDEYKKLYKAYPYVEEYRVEYVSFLLDDDQLEEAEKVLDSFENDPTDITSSKLGFLKSEILWKRKKYKESLDILEKSLRMDHSLPTKSQFELINIYFNSSETDTLINRILKIAIQQGNLNEKDTLAKIFLGDLLLRSNQKKEALKYYIQAIKLDPGNFGVWKNILRLEIEHSLYDSLEVHAETALEYFPNLPIPYFYLGVTHFFNGYYEQSVSILKIGLKYARDPGLLTLFYAQIGDSYSKMKKFVKAFAHYEKALKNAPNNNQVLNNYSYYLALEKQELGKAYEMSSKLIESFPMNPTYIDTHAWVLYNQKRYKEAKNILSRIIENDHKDNTLYEHFGDILFKLNEKAEALKYWKKALELDNDNAKLSQKIKNQKFYE